MSGSARTMLATLAVGALVTSGLVLTAPAAVAAHPPESLTVLHTSKVAVVSSTGQHLTLTIDAVRHSASATKPDTHSKSTATVTLAKVGSTESHAWTFNLAKDSFTSSGSADGHLKTGTQIAPYGLLRLRMSAPRSGVRHGCGAGDYEIDHKVVLKGAVKVKTHSTGTTPWGNVKLTNAKLKGKLYGGHGPDNEEACAGFPPCVHGISWLASKDLGSTGSETISGDLVGRKGKTPVGKIRGNRFTDLTTPTGAFRIDNVVAKAASQVLSVVHNKETLTITPDAAQPATGTATLTASGSSPYANGCAGGQEKGTLWTAKYSAASEPLTFNEDVFGPISITAAKSATFEKFHIA